MASVSLDRLFKVYGSTQVVRGIDLHIEDKEFVVLVGPSGCGKTTTLRMIAGLEEASAGEIRIGDRVVNGVRAKDRDIAMVFQSYGLYPHMNVYDNMAFGLKLRGVPRDEIATRVRKAAQILGIETLLDRKPRQLSGGQRQRVALGRSIVRQPQVFLFDEPLSNLDAKLRVTMRAELKKLHQRLEATMVYVTHDQIEAMTMGDRIVIMKDGVIQQVGRPMDVYARPANQFVAGFIGSPSMNFATCNVRAEGDHLVLSNQGMSLAAPRDRQDKLGPFVGREIVVGIRPEDIRADGVEGDAYSQFDARVEIIEPIGHETYLGVSAGGQDLLARVGPEGRYEVGQPVTLAATSAKLHLFNPQTLEAIA
jgi:multiple sugar transport system ATP-binding protein